jgi:hypothetical protein
MDHPSQPPSQCCLTEAEAERESLERMVRVLESKSQGQLEGEQRSSAADLQRHLALGRSLRSFRWCPIGTWLLMLRGCGSRAVEPPGTSVFRVSSWPIRASDFQRTRAQVLSPCSRLCDHRCNERLAESEARAGRAERLMQEARRPSASRMDEA